jgi:hypothetical protein
MPLNEKELFFPGESQLISSCFLIVVDYLLDRNSQGSVIKVEVNKLGNGVEVVYTDTAGVLTESQISSQFDLFNSLTHSLGFAKMIADIHEGYLTISNNESKGVKISVGVHTRKIVS